MQRTLNAYTLKERELAEAACHRLNRDPYVLMRNEAKRPTYELSYDQADNMLKIIATYYPLDRRQFERKQIRNRKKVTE